MERKQTADAGLPFFGLTIHLVVPIVEGAINTDADAVMCAYNLRNPWKFTDWVMTDWAHPTTFPLCRQGLKWRRPIPFS